MGLQERPSRGARRALVGARQPIREDNGRHERAEQAQRSSSRARGVGSPAGADHVRMFSAANLGVAPPRFEVERHVIGDTLVFTPRGELDAAAVPVLEAEMVGAVGTTRAILLDMKSLTFVDSCGLWLITLTFSSCRDAGVHFALTRGPDQIRSIFEITGLSDVLPFVDDQE